MKLCDDLVIKEKKRFSSSHPLVHDACPRDAVPDHILRTGTKTCSFHCSIGDDSPSAATFPRTNQGPRRKQMFVHHPDMFRRWHRTAPHVHMDLGRGTVPSPSVGRRTWPPPRARLCVPEPLAPRRPPRARACARGQRCVAS